MKKQRTVFKLLMGFVLISVPFYAQEKDPELDIEESAEVFLEEYSDEFEVAFFEGLKQKGIENYDRAINAFLECKRLDAQNIVVDHELAKAYLANKEYNLARGYGLTALVAEPANMWYLRTLVDILEKQGGNIETLNGGTLTDHLKLQENLALIYYQKGKYEAALSILKKLQNSSFLTELASKINDSIEKRDQNSIKTTFSTNTNTVDEPTTVDGYKRRIQNLIPTENHLGLIELANEALERFPAQPYFYYAQGYALNKTGKYREAIEILEAALDYMLDDVALANKIYTELSEAYNGINDSVKANMYLRKVKPGF